MSFKTKLYLKLAEILNRVQGYLATELQGYYALKAELERRLALKKAMEHADEFLAWFRQGRTTFSAQKKREENPNCRHTKGGKTQGIVKDYNLTCHTFPDNSTKIWCLNGCGFTSRPGDANWLIAMQMMEQSSNRPSTSERTFYGVPESGKYTTIYQDKI